MKQKFIIISVGMLLVIALLSGCLGTSEGSYEVKNVENTENTENTVNTGNVESADDSTQQINSDAGISIAVSYMPEVTDETVFEIQVMSHKDYNDDFENNSFLRDANGKTYTALSYEGTAGHHAKGVIRFPKMDIKSVELVITDVAGIDERVFKW